MIKRIWEKIFGTANDRKLKQIQPIVDEINGLSDRYEAMSDADLKACTGDFRQRFDNGEPLESILPEAFAVTREVAWRTLGMRHYDVQLVGGIVLYRGMISEMKTGEGKTLAATLPIYLHGMTGKGAHLVTVNDYLAKRDAEWMGRIYRFLGLSVGTIVHGLTNEQRREAYAADVTYATNNELGFDYLRDNMKFRLEDYVQRELNYCIVDEVDSILIDEARTPLIISGQAEMSTDKYYRANEVISKLVQKGFQEGVELARRAEEQAAENPEVSKGLRALAKSIKGDQHDDDISGDYYWFTIDEKSRNAILTDAGVEWVQERMGVDNLYDPGSMEVLHSINKAIVAHTLYRKEVEYIVEDSQVVIIDEFTGRKMPGRRWSDGLHQAIEAKENVKVQNENQTLASITFQNFFRMYNSLAGMTGTAETEKKEFMQIYGLDVSVIPTNQPVQRLDHQDMVYKTPMEKYNAVVQEIIECRKRGQPVLVGTVTVEVSEILSKLLNKRKIRHNVLNAKFHEKEAEVVAQAGRKGAVTIATNMAGRGTDIVLGGNPEFLAWLEVGTDAPLEEFQEAFERIKAKCEAEKQEVLDAGGLHIIGTERHESRRIDNQLRGRSGRQGDPGSSRFYMSLEDDLMRIFGGDRIKQIIGWTGLEEGEPIEHKMLSRAIENAQIRVEGRNFDIRKNVLEYDDVMNQQRTTIYRLRREILEGGSEEERFFDVVEDLVVDLVQSLGPQKGRMNDWDSAELIEEAFKNFSIDLRPRFESDPPEDLEAIQEMVYAEAEKEYHRREGIVTEVFEDGGENWRAFLREQYLRILDQLWRDHLLQMDHLREGIGLRGYGSRDPKLEYKKEGFAMFTDMMDRIGGDLVHLIYHVHIQTKQEIEEARERERQARERERERMRFTRGDNQPQKAAQIKRKAKKVGRNDPCPCGSGKKFKKCHWGQSGYEQYM